MNLTPASVKNFRRLILAHYKRHGRNMPWRGTTDPYRILVSEIMLQQTQVSRVTEKFGQFVKAFPDFKALDRAALAKVYKVWQGLGYNRRALYLKRIARIVVADHGGVLPHAFDDLCLLPGIGPATASSTMAFAFNSPAVFIETNIRTVFIHCFFKKKGIVSDDEIAVLVEKTLWRKNPRVWYWALMDYGNMLKNSGFGKNSRSAHYAKQSRFEGSKRQKRGKVLRLLLARKRFTLSEIQDELQVNADAATQILNALKKEGFVRETGGTFGLQTCVTEAVSILTKGR